MGDGCKAAWAVFESHRPAAGFIGVLDFLRRLSHPHAAACAGEDDPRRVAAETLGYVENNRGRRNYPE